MIYYKQCQLKRGGMITTAWIPEEFAKLHSYVKLYEDNGWVDGYRVEAVGLVRLEESVMLKRSEDYKNTRKASDI